MSLEAQEVADIMTLGEEAVHRYGSPSRCYFCPEAEAQASTRRVRLDCGDIYYIYACEKCLKKATSKLLE